jgi:hypothetical protein
MKKDKEWLKGLINEEGIVMDMHLLGRLDEQYWKNENIKINKGRLFCLIDKLDEPEVLSQEWIDENKVARIDNLRKMTTSDVVTVEKLQNLLVQKQDKPIIPKFVANEIERYEDMLDMLSGEYFYRTSEEIDDDGLLVWIDENQETFARAWLDGYEVEKEKRYYIVDKTNNSTLMTFELSDVVGEEIIEFVYGYSENETIHFNSKEKAELVAHFVGESLEVEEVTE